MRILKYVIKTARNKEGHISICKDNKMCTFSKKKYKEWSCIFVEGKESTFVLKQTDYLWMGKRTRDKLEQT